MNSKLSLAPEILSSVGRALKEDIGGGDVTTDSIVPAGASVKATIVAKQAGVIAGLAIAEAVFHQLDQTIEFQQSTAEGDLVTRGQPLVHLKGKARAILTGERTALNFLGRMSGIATLTRQFVEAISDTGAKILDTRKTAPNLRPGDKLAVKLGGGLNHRMGLYDMILIKDNHIDFAGSITEAVHRARRFAHQLKIEVECRTLTDVEECVGLGVDWIMLDNMPLEDIRHAVALNGGRAKIEASGNVNLGNARAIAETGVDFISVGALTHSPAAFDVTLIVNWTSAGRIQ